MATWLYLVSFNFSGLALESPNAICLGADGTLASLIQVPGGGSRCPTSQESIQQGKHYVQMSGKETFKHAVRTMRAAITSSLEKNNLSIADIRWLVPHQANERIIDAIAKDFAIPGERIYKTIHKYGNTSASSIAIALDELTREYPPQEGDRFLLVAFGAGLTWGAAILTEVKE